MELPRWPQISSGDGLYLWVYRDAGSIGACGIGRLDAKNHSPLGFFPKLPWAKRGKSAKNCASSFPVLGKRPLDQIEATELLQAIRAIEARGSYDLAHRVLQVCGQVFRYGIATGRCTRNLSADLRGALTPHVKRHQAAIRSEELPDLLGAIAKYDEIGGKQTRLALQLMAQTFLRTKELIGAEWQRV